MNFREGGIRRNLGGPLNFEKALVHSIVKMIYTKTRNMTGKDRTCSPIVLVCDGSSPGSRGCHVMHLPDRYPVFCIVPVVV